MCPSTRVAKLRAAFGLCGLFLMLGCPSEIDPTTVTATVVQYGLSGRIIQRCDMVWVQDPFAPRAGIKRRFWVARFKQG